jgi:hypothetical protein
MTLSRIFVPCHDPGRSVVGSDLGRVLVGRWLAIIAILFFTGSISGCGPGTDGRVKAAGEVMLDGTPLDNGTIELHPKSPGGTMTGGMINNGKFEIPAEQGPKPGSYEVRIFAAANTGATVNPNEPPGPESQAKAPAERIPPRFNVKSELTTEIGANGEEALKFEVKSK